VAEQPSDEDIRRLSQGLPPVASGPELPAGTAGPAEMPGDRSALPVAPPDAVAPSAQPGQDAMPLDASGIPQTSIPGGPQPTAGPSAVPLSPGVPAPAALPAPSAVPAGTHATKGEETVKTVVPSAQTLEGNAGELSALKAQQVAADKQSDIAQRRAQMEAEQAQALADQQRQDDIDRAAEVQAEADRRAEIAKERAVQWAQLQQDAKSKPPMFGVTQALEAALGLVGVIGTLSVRNAGPSGRGRDWGGATSLGMQTLGLIDAQVDRTYKQHTAEIEQRYHALATRDGYNDQLARQAQQDMALADAQRVHTYEHLGKFYDSSMKAALGTEAAGNSADIVHAHWDQQIAQANQKAGEKLNVNVTTATSFAPGRAGASTGAGGGRLSQLQEFARANPGPGNTAKVTAYAEKLFPGMKPAQLQTMTDTAIKATSEPVDSNGRKLPTEYIDPITKQVFPVDRNRTDTAAFNHAQTVLPPIATFLKTADSLLGSSAAGSAPSWLASLGKDTSVKAKADADVLRLRSAYAKAKGESIGSENAQELAKAIPMPPSWPTTDASIKNWREQTQAYVDEMRDLQRATAGAAGIDLDQPGKGGAAESKPKAPAVTETRVAPDGRTLQKLSDGSVRVAP